MMEAKTLLDIVDKDLAGYRLRAVYWLRQDHHLMQVTPALRADTRKVAMFYDRELAHVAISHVKSSCRIVIEKGIAIVQEETGEGFMLSDGDCESIFGRQPLNTMSADELNLLISSCKERPFIWG